MELNIGRESVETTWDGYIESGSRDVVLIYISCIQQAESYKFDKIYLEPLPKRIMP